MKRIAAELVLILFFFALSPRAARAEAGVRYEAEQAARLGAVDIIEDTEASQGLAVGDFSREGDAVDFQISVPRDGLYDLAFVFKGIGGQKTNTVCVDGVEMGNVTCAGTAYDSAILRKTPLTAGEHTVTFRKSWGWCCLDYLTVTESASIPESVYTVTAPLANQNANEETQALYSLLRGYYGSSMLSGQYCDDGVNGAEVQAIYALTGEYPAILGLDLADYAPSRTVFGTWPKSVDYAIEYHRLGGVVTFCWHWNAPPHTLLGETDENGNPLWWSGFYTKNTSFDVGRALRGEDPEGKAALDADIQAIADQLKRLEENHVPVLWRPLHEASGGWFWWGACGPEVYRQLWIYLFDQLTWVYGCSNLIWVWNGQHPDWYPGDEYVDIIGEDIYVSPRQYTAYTSEFSEAAEYTQAPKIIALTENAVLPDVEGCVSANAQWAWFCTWQGSFVVDEDGCYSSVYTEAQILQKVYASEYVITLAKLRQP